MYTDVAIYPYYNIYLPLINRVKVCIYILFTTYDNIMYQKCQHIAIGMYWNNFRNNYMDME